MRYQIIIAVVGLALFCSNAFAQEKRQENEEKSKFGLIFSLSGLNELRLSEFNNGVGVKYFFKENVAFRGVVNLTIESTDNATPQGSARAESDLFGIQFRPGLEFHFDGRNQLSPYFGGDLLFERNSSNQKSISDLEVRDNDTDRTIYGAGFFLGVEVYPVKFLSLSGEYSVELLFESLDSESSVDGDLIIRNERDSTRMNTSSLGMLTLTFYF